MSRQPLDAAAVVDLLTDDVRRAMALVAAPPPGLAVQQVRVAVGQRPGDAAPLLPDPLHPDRGWLAEVVLTPAAGAPAGGAVPVLDRLSGLPLTALRGVDDRTAERYAALDVPDVGALGALPVDRLSELAAGGLRLVDGWSRAVLLDRVVAATGVDELDAAPLAALLLGGVAPLAARTSPAAGRTLLAHLAALAAALDVAVLRTTALRDVTG